MDYHKQQLTILLWCSIIVGGLGLLLAALGGLLLTRRAMIPIRAAFTRQYQFVADASHELRTPLAIIRANAETALRHPTKTVESQQTYINDIIIETDYLHRMVADLLLLARSDLGQLQLTETTIDLSVLVYEMQRQITPLAEERGLIFAVDPPTTPILVSGDPMRLRQLLLILLDNAMKYTSVGGAIGLRISGALSNPAFDESNFGDFDITGATWPGSFVGQPISVPAATIHIYDTGSGIPETHLARIFDRFYRVDKARSHEEGSVGLGLAIARWIVEAHRGTIDVRSKQGKGSVFSVKLPLTTQPQDQLADTRFGIAADA